MDSIFQDPAWRGEAPVPSQGTATVDEGTSVWPRMLELDEETENRLALYLEYEIEQSWLERDRLSEDWKQWQRDYWAKPTKKVKNFPFKKAANVVIPMTAIATEAIYARILTTIFATKPFYSTRPRIAEWIEVAPNVESWLQTEVESVDALDMDGFARESLLEFIKLGTAVGKSGYERDIRKVNEDVPGGGSRGRWVEVKNGPTLDYTPLANFLMRLHEKDPQTATWVGEEHFDVTWAQLKREALAGRMKAEAVEAIKHWWTEHADIQSTGQDYDEDRRQNEDLEPSWKETFEFQEIWLSFDVDGDGVDEEIVVDFHKPSRTFLSIRYNWYQDLHRPYRIGNFIPVEGRWVGIGVGKQLEQFQPLITSVHRQRLDAGTLANMMQLAVKKTCGYTSDEPIWPGKIWFLDNPAQDILPFSLSNHQHFSQIQNEEAARLYADKRSGVNELVLGTPAVGTPAPASSDMARLAEGNKKFDMVLKNVRRWLSLIGLDVLANYQQFGSSGRSWLIRGQDGEFVEQFLSLPQSDIRRGLYVELTVTDSITNKSVEQQQWTQLFSILSAHYDKFLERAAQVAGIIQDPQLFIAATQLALSSSNTSMRRLLEAYQVPDIDSFLLEPDELARLYAGPQEGGGGEPGPSGVGSETNGASGVAGLLGALDATGVRRQPGGAVTVERLPDLG